MDKCKKFGCTPRINNYGVSWCTECGKLFPFNLNHKPINKNFLTEASKENYSTYIGIDLREISSEELKQNRIHVHNYVL